MQPPHSTTIVPSAAWLTFSLQNYLPVTLVRTMDNVCAMLDILNHFYLLAFLLGDPANALANPAGIKGPVTSNIFEAKRDNVRAAMGQAVIAAASHCKQHGCVPHLMLCYSI